MLSSRGKEFGQFFLEIPSMADIEYYLVRLHKVEGNLTILVEGLTNARKNFEKAKKVFWQVMCKLNDHFFMT